MLIGPEGDSPAEQFVAEGRAAAARDALAALQSLPGVGRVLIATPDPAWREWGAENGCLVDVDEPGAEFHFGRRLAELCDRYDLRRIFYLGAGSLPLLGREQLAETVEEIAGAAGPTPVAVTNNRHSSDWLAVSEAEGVRRLPDRLPKDNSLAWVLANEAGVRVRSLPASAATRVDIDTPFDLLLLSMYPRLGGELAGYLAGQAGRLPLAPLRGALDVLGRTGAQAALIGRVASSAWAYLEARTQLWVRVFSEERGMSASGRQEAGQVRSLVAAHMALVGEEQFFAELGEMAETALVDTRLLLAHHRSWPSAADRYRSDLGEWESIRDPWLRRFTRAATSASIPVVLGGHGVVAGGLYAMADIVQERAGREQGTP
jgi:CTP:molybdopterin cytidylyltransferase MocA